MKDKKKNNLIEDIKNSIVLLKLGNIKPKYFAFVTGLALVVTVLNTYSVGLLFPLVNGIINGSFDRIQSIPIIRSIVNLFPTVFVSPISLLVLIVVFLYIITLLKNGMQYYSQLHSQLSARNSTVELRNKLFSACVHLGKRFYDEHKISFIHHTFMRLPKVMESHFLILQKFTVNIILVIAYVSIMFFISWQLTIIVIIVFPIIALLTNVIVFKIRAMAHDNDGKSMVMSEYILNILYCMPVVKGFTKEENEIKSFSVANQAELDNAFKARKFINLIDPIEEVSTTTAALIVVIGIAILISGGQTFHTPSLIIFFILAFKVFKSASVFNALRINMASAEPVIENIGKILKADEQHYVLSGKEEMPSIKNNIEIKNLSFTYPNKKEKVLKDISFSIPKGQVTALVGATGSGKSTITNILLRLYDCEPNTVLVDGIDIRKFSVSSVRNKMSFVYQDHLLFSNSILHNITYGADENEYPKEEDIEKTIKALCLSDVVDGVDGGTNTIVGDNASNLSGGQKRLVSLVRAMLRDHDFLIMDEATSSLDVSTEKKVMDEVISRSKDKTVLIVSHRLSTIKHADSIVFLEDGVIVEQGSYDKLMEKKGAFYNQWFSEEE